MAVLRHLEGFFEKSEESRPPLKLKNNGGLLSPIFSKNHSKCLKTAILPLKLQKGLKVDIFKENCHFEALTVVLGKNARNYFIIFQF